MLTSDVGGIANMIRETAEQRRQEVTLVKQPGQLPGGQLAVIDDDHRRQPRRRDR